MKKKIIAFLSVLAISAVSFCGVVEAAKSYAYNEGNDSTFCLNASGPNILVRANGHAGSVKALNSSDYSHQKYVEITGYIYDDTTESFTQEYDGWDVGLDRTVTATTTLTSNTTNTLVIGMIGYSDISQTGWHYAGASNVSKNSATPCLDPIYYNYLQGYDK